MTTVQILFMSMLISYHSTNATLWLDNQLEHCLSINPKAQLSLYKGKDEEGAVRIITAICELNVTSA